MISDRWPNPLHPVDDIREAILVRTVELPLTAFQQDLVDHVAGRVRTQEEFNAYRPSFYGTHLAPRFSAYTDARALRFKFLEPMLHELEMALACCEYATAPVPKPLAYILQRALAHCHVFDELRALERRLESERAEHRRRGGKARQAKLDCARFRAARLILVRALAGGWKSEAEAARAIEPGLIAFIKRRRLSMICEEHLRRTIVRWIRKHPIVRAAYLATRRDQT